MTDTPLPLPPVLDLTPAELVARARALADGRGRCVLGIVGAPGAGKSTVSDVLTEALGEKVAVVGMDGFHLDDRVLDDLGRRARKGAPDTFDAGGYVALLHRLRAATDDVVYAPRFDRSLETSVGSAVPVGRDVPLVVTEGNYLLHDEGGWEAVRPVLDVVWFLDVAPEERRRRLVARRMGHGEDETSALDWVTRVDEPNGATVDACRARADLVIRLVNCPATPTTKESV